MGTFDIADDVLDENFVLPIGKAKVQRQGKDITLVAHSIGVGFCIGAADILAKDGISCEVINLRSIRPLDVDTVNESVKKTKHLITVEGGFPKYGVGAEVCAQVIDGPAFHYLDAPIIRVAGADVPMPYAVSLEKLATPQAEDVVKAVKKSLESIKKNKREAEQQCKRLRCLKNTLIFGCAKQKKKKSSARREFIIIYTNQQHISHILDKRVDRS